MRDHPDRIPIENCQHGSLYRIYSRNLNLGVYRESDRGFIGIRHKMGARFLFIEFHWDIGPPHGTANPLELICECTVPCLDKHLGVISQDHIEDNSELFEWIEHQGQLLGITPESC